MKSKIIKKIPCWSPVTKSWHFRKVGSFSSDRDVNVLKMEYPENLMPAVRAFADKYQISNLDDIKIKNYKYKFLGYVATYFEYRKDD